jgi:hypothetical protein
MSEYKSPLKAIRDNCVDCSGGTLKEVRNCVIHNCPLYPFRMGRNPNRSRNIINEHSENPLSIAENETGENEP